MAARRCCSNGQEGAVVGLRRRRSNGQDSGAENLGVMPHHPSLRGVSALDGKSKYLGGISFILGRNNEFAFSGGYALASLPKISNLYQSSTITTTTTTTTTTTGSTNTTTTGTTPSTANTTTSGTSTSTATVTAPEGKTCVK